MQCVEVKVLTASIWNSNREFSTLKSAYLMKAAGKHMIKAMLKKGEERSSFVSNEARAPFSLLVRVEMFK